MKKFFQFSVKHLLGLALLLTFTNYRAQFSAGNIVVLQAGDGVTTLTNTGNPIVLREFNTLGVPTFSMAAPTTGTNALLISGSATSEGCLSLSANGKLLVFGGYAKSLPNSISLAGATASSVNRGIGVVNGSATYSLAASSASLFSTNNIRAASSDGLNNFWGAGSNDGTDYFGTASTPTIVQNSKVNQRAVAIFNNQLYFSTQSSAGTPSLLGVYSVGVGLPTSSSQTISNVINTGTGSQPTQFYFNSSSTPTICYVADGRSNGSGGVQKWVNSLGTWTLAYTLSTGSSTTGAVGVIADFSGANPIVYATTAETALNRLVGITDIGVSSTPTTLATSTINTVFKGLAFSPCDAPSALSSSVSSICANQTLSLNVTSTGSSPFSYLWSGAGSFNSNTIANPLVTGAASSNYTVTVTNACGTASSIVTVSLETLPTVLANATSSSICVGQSVTLNGAGATSYTWSAGVTDGNAFTPTATDSYTVTGTGSNGCTNSSVVTVTVDVLPTIAINSATICTGQSATLIASGASTYTWNTSSNANPIVVSPTANSTYSVIGTSTAGCSNTATTQVAVIALPTITVSSSTICSGDSATLIASGANTYTWNTGANTASIIVTPSSNATYTISGNLLGCTIAGSNTAFVNVNPLPTISIAASSGTLCTGQSTTLTASGASTYTWSNLSITNSIVVTPTVSSTYSVLGVSTAGCFSTGIAQVSVIPLPTIIVNSSTICSGNSATLIATGASSYTWDTGANTTSVIVTPSVNTTYSVIGNTSGCIATSSNTASVIVNPLPTLAIVSTTSLLCSGQSATLSASGGVTYTWSGGPNGVNYVISPTVTTTFSVAATGSNACVNTNTFTQNVSICTSLNKLNDVLFFNLYPNPAVKEVNLEFTDNSKKTVELFDLLGKKIYSVTFSDKQTLTIDVSALNKGVYTLIIQNDNLNVTKKLFVD